MINKSEPWKQDQSLLCVMERDALKYQQMLLMLCSKFSYTLPLSARASVEKHFNYGTTPSKIHQITDSMSQNNAIFMIY